MKSAGGTELQVNYLNKYLDLSKYENINLIINQAAFKRIEAKKKNILWCHHYIDQPSIKLLKNAELVKLLDAIVFVSEWQKGEFINHFNLPENKCHVLKNAVNIEPIKENKTNKKIRLIYTSTPWRGLNVLANSIQYLNEKRDDFHLDVYSSTEIYGEKFHNENKANFENFFKQLSQIPNITSHGYVPNNEIISKLKEADIFVYPTTSNETFCIAALEALASGPLCFRDSNILSIECPATPSRLTYPAKPHINEMIFYSKDISQIANKYTSTSNQTYQNSLKAL